MMTPDDLRKLTGMKWTDEAAQRVIDSIRKPEPDLEPESEVDLGTETPALPTSASQAAIGITPNRRRIDPRQAKDVASWFEAESGIHVPVRQYASLLATLDTWEQKRSEFASLGI